MKNLIVAALLTSAMLAQAQTATPAPAAPSAPATPAVASSPAKKALVQKLLSLQSSDFEDLARNIVGQSLAQMVPAVRQALLQQVPADKREATGKTIEGDIKMYVDESVPLIRDRAIKLAPSTIGVTIDEKFTEDELKQVIAWLESPLNKKYQQLGPEFRGNFTQKLMVEVRPLVEPKYQALEQKVRATLGVPAPGSAASGAGPSKAAAPAKKASGK